MRRTVPLEGTERSKYLTPFLAHLAEEVRTLKDDMDAMIEQFPSLLRDDVVPRYILDTARALCDDGIMGICLGGMGGSSIAGEICRALLLDISPIPILSVRDYFLPNSVTDNWVCIVTSYSGNTEETLSVLSDAQTRNAHVFAVTTGGKLAQQVDRSELITIEAGLQPRAALPLIFSAEYSLLLTLIGQPRLDFQTVAETLKSARERWRQSEGIVSPDSVARQIRNAIPMFVGARHLAPVAYRAKCQVNENAKSLAMFAELPEMDHNEIEGSGRYGAHRVVPVFLRSRSEDERMRRRIEATISVLREEGATVLEVPSLGPDPVTEALGAVLYCDEVSLLLARLLSINATEVARIGRLKEIMRGA